MINAVFAHGKPPRERYENSALPQPHEANWFPWAKQQLAARGIDALVPSLPKPYYPEYSAWKEVFLGSRIEKDTGLIGFSAGADFLLRLLSEENVLSVERLVLVAPWRDVDGKYGDFSKYTLDAGIDDRVGQLSVISSIDDSEQIQSNARNIIAELPGSKLVELDGYGHFMIGNNMTSEEFPELITELLSEQGSNVQ